MPRRTSAFTYVAERSLGLSNDFQDAVYQEQVSQLTPVARNYIYDGGMRVWCMEIDPVDDRYLLVGTSKSVINLYDLKALDDRDVVDPIGSDTRSSSHYDWGNRLPVVSSVVAHQLRRERQSVSSSSSVKAVAAQHQALSAGITAIDWYPVDGGLFATSSFDGLVRVWDANVFTVEVEFSLNCKVFGAKFSPISTTHSLIAATTANREVRLCDMTTDASIHSLLGHQDEVWSLAWSNVNEFQLCTGSRNGEIRMWDIRKSGATACLFCLNHEGEADVPGRSSLYTNVKKLPSTSIHAASRTAGQSKRRRVEGQPAKERNDPNMAASVSLARGHSAAVNSLAYTPDGRYLLSSGHDHRVRMWSARSGEHLFVNFDGVVDPQIPRGVQMAAVQEGDAKRGTMLFHPNGNEGALTSYRLHSDGDTTDSSQALVNCVAHYKPITACVYRKSKRELLTGATDGLVMRWVPTPATFEADDKDETQSSAAATVAADDEDAWSEDDEGDGGGLPHNDNVFVPPILRQTE